MKEGLVFWFYILCILLMALKPKLHQMWNEHKKQAEKAKFAGDHSDDGIKFIFCLRRHKDIEKRQKCSEGLDPVQVKEIERKIFEAEMSKL